MLGERAQEALQGTEEGLPSQSEEASWKMQGQS